MEYWKECISIAADECGLKLTDEQLKCLADSVEAGHDNYGMAHGYDVIGSPAEIQAEKNLRELRSRIQQEEDWKSSTKPCRTCTTTGSVKDGWGRFMSCPDCDGKGRIKY